MKSTIKTMLLAAGALCTLVASASAVSLENTNIDYKSLTLPQAQIEMSNIRSEYETALADGDEKTAEKCVDEANALLDAQIEHLDTATISNSRISADLSPYFTEVKWEKRSDGICLTIYPTTYLTDFHESTTIYNQSWTALRNHYSKDSYWKNESCLKKQYMCHCFYGRLNIPWNIEPYKTSINPITCN